ncbi:cupin domain-containing protein [Psychrosphaera ytuae]|uniref:Cupin domain-containing protein n=1 Tax=Psychrosphaera ytuae TaxID=2820710 RepID=A0A975DBG4_9GAMM|nr:cupin domain-containing protein [Psychrosphaera ytuae]QTH64085.1 cupin domain-containing protein [Psychrosphaera ytuae]
MNINWTNLSQQTFITEYWNKKPVVLKAAVTNFDDPIDANDLAGLAMEEVVESRIVRCDQGWNVKHGPFSDYGDLPERQWSLLVQGVDRWIPEVHELRKLVSFLPQWQIDDVMVSFSSQGGGVGAHLDQYNVFILQGQGRRHWQVGAVDKTLQQKETVTDLLQVDSFDAIIDEILEPGDLLYIPPFSPHCGETLEDAMSYSIGFRAPSQTELLTSFADYIFENELGKNRFSTQVNSNPSRLKGAIPGQDIDALKQFMLESIESGRFEHFAHQFLTEPTRELDIVPSEHEWSESQLLQTLQSEHVQLNKVLGLQTSYRITEQSLQFFCNGMYFSLAPNQLNLIEILSKQETMTSKELKSSLVQLENITLLTTLINTGYWYISE